MAKLPISLAINGVSTRVFPDRTSLGAAAASDAAAVIQGAVREFGIARILVATGNSQLTLIAALASNPSIPWNAVHVFHLDEYVGLSASHPASFRRWVKTNLVGLVKPAQVSYLEGDAADLEGEIARYAGLLSQSRLDLAFVGFGENGHIAFNDPPVADFHDPLLVKKVELDDACRRQQAGEGHFPSVEMVPREALTITCSGLMRVAGWICAVPDVRKAQAVSDALKGPLSTKCPASLVREHPNAIVYLDAASASLLSL